MFTGLVEGQGVVRSTEREDSAIRLVIEVPPEFLAGGKLGDSVAIDGCCLTVVQLDGRRWHFQAGPETLAKTSLGRIEPGDTVNLERPLAADGRLGGHFVQGHVDGIGQVDSIDANGEWVTIWFLVPEQLTRQMVSKGSVSVDGISLTVVEVEKDRFSVALIPHTLEMTTLGAKIVNDPVNIETDVLAKYVQKLTSGENS